MTRIKDIFNILTKKTLSITFDRQSPVGYYANKYNVKSI